MELLHCGYACWHSHLYFKENMRTEFNLYKVDMKYIRNLHNKDDKVPSVSPQIGKEGRVFVGIVVVCGKHKYCIPLSSPKEKHNHMKDSIDFSKIVVNNELLGVLNYNLMIPIEEEQLQQIDIVERKRDRLSISKYKEKCRKELKWCQEHSEIICNKANVLYEMYLSGDSFRARNRCLDFSKLEKECKRYNSK